MRGWNKKYINLHPEFCYQKRFYLNTSGKCVYDIILIRGGQDFMDCPNFAGSLGHTFVGPWFVAITVQDISLLIR